MHVNKPAIKVAHLYPVPGGGVQRYAKTLIDGLSRISQRIQVAHIVVGQRAGDSDVRQGEQTFIVPSQRHSSFDYSPLSDCVCPDSEMQFRRILEDMQPDIVHFHDLSYTGASLIGIAHDRGIRTVVTLHDYWFFCPRSFLIRRDFELCHGPNGGANCISCIGSTSDTWNNMLMEHFQRSAFMKSMLVDKTDKVLLVSDSMRDIVTRHGVAEHKLECIHPALDDPAVPYRPQSDPDAIRIGYIGAVSPHKGLHVLLEAMRQLRSDRFHLSVYGGLDTLYQTSLLRITKDLNTVKFHGTYREEQLDEIFASMDVLVVPSVCRETGPLVVQEALRRKVPVIGSNIGGIPEYVTSEYGALFDAGNVHQLAQLLEQIIQSPELVSQWRARIPHLDKVDDFARQVMDVYEQMMVSTHTAEVSIVDSQHYRLLGAHDRGFLRRTYLPQQLGMIDEWMKQASVARIVIFGAGALGQNVARHVQGRGYAVRAFVDNDAAKHGSTISAIPIIGPKDIDSSGVQAVLVASDWEAQIIQQLHELHVSIPVVGLYSFGQ